MQNPRLKHLLKFSTRSMSYLEDKSVTQGISKKSIYKNMYIRLFIDNITPDLQIILLN